MSPTDVQDGGAADDATRILVFTVGSRRYGLILDVVREVFEMVEPPVPVPGAPGWVGGVINHHGEVVPLVHLDRFLGLAGTGGAQVILARLDESLFALGVDQVESLESVRLEGPAYQGRRRAWYHGALLDLLDPGHLAQDLMRRAARDVDAGQRA